jgi:hypothetical protein
MQYVLGRALWTSRAIMQRASKKLSAPLDTDLFKRFYIFRIGECTTLMPMFGGTSNACVTVSFNLMALPAVRREHSKSLEIPIEF